MKRLIATIAILTLSNSMTIAKAQQEQPKEWFPGVTVPSPPPPPSPNALDDFHKAYTLEAEKDLIEKTDAKITLAQKKRILEDNQQAIDAIYVGLSHEYQAPVVSSFATKNTHSAEERSLGRLLKLAAETDREEGDWSGTARRALDTIHLGLKIEDSAGMGYLSGIVCELYGRELLWSAIDHLSGPEAHAAGAELAAWVSKRPSYTEVLQDLEWSNQRFFITAFDQAKASDIADIQKTLGVKDPRELYDQYTAHMDVWIAASRQPFVSRVLPNIKDYKDKLSSVLIPNLGNALFGNDNFRTQDGLLITTLALHSYYADHKSYPDTLDALVPQYMSVVPVDPYSKGDTLRYKSAKSTYRLYSIGPDGIDDDGTSVIDPAAKQDTPEARHVALQVKQESKGDIVAGVNL